MSSVLSSGCHPPLSFYAFLIKEIITRMAHSIIIEMNVRKENKETTAKALTIAPCIPPITPGATGCLSASAGECTIRSMSRGHGLAAESWDNRKWSRGAILLTAPNTG